ncbi:MAG: FHA domain-containing protein [Bryobacteraceae bacterium]
MAKTYKIGRDPAADIPIADPSVSRFHAEATVDDGGQILITDCNSSNGTFLIRGGAEQPVRQERLLPNDQVKFGNVAITVDALAAAIRRKDPARPLDQTAPVKPQPVKPQPIQKAPREFSDSTRLVRCACGAIKAMGSQCGTCGR